MSQSLN